MLGKLQEIVSPLQDRFVSVLWYLTLDYRSFPAIITNHVGAQNENVDCFLVCAFGKGDRHFLAYRNTEKAVAHCKNKSELEEA